jgi:hypothetical protein
MIRKCGHLVEHGVNLGHNIHAIDATTAPTIDKDSLAFGSAQSDMQNGALFGDVDLVAREHGVDVVAQAGLLCKVNKHAEGLAGNSVLRKVEVQTQGLQREAFVALRIVGKELSKV